ncbi:hypothetical protein ASPFODRAFT_518259 [Aspergillus luchuensis CBS 106.47]|uniref:Uncharacterized protein n=1 Tax=Aspergillus luchuensis (strain CBS 106.47) TaxID=1137211 RepID=A0A1M3SZK1_ASPLC|nr:hypothetical protein ASPFODRAFT_518259 [Aspergillus luchuensis CBS 106.47]
MDRVMPGWVNRLLYSGQACSTDQKLRSAAALDTQLTFSSAHQQTEHGPGFARSGPGKESPDLTNERLTSEPDK